MSTTPHDPEDELAGTEQPFVAHLVELRDRLIRACIAIGVVAAVLAIWPGPAALYDILAAPLVAHLPKGARAEQRRTAQGTNSVGSTIRRKRIRRR